MDILVSPAFVQTFISVLKIHGTSQIQILSSDIQSIIDQEKIEYNTNSRKKRHDNSINKGTFDVQAYHRYDEIVEYMLNLKETFPELVQILNITKSFENRDLIGIKIGKEQAIKPSFFIDAGIHAREWIAPATAIYIINEMLNQYGKDLTITKIVDNFDWYIVPVGNPDGYEYSITKIMAKNSIKKFNC
uniref:Peptidase M14 carboxypeptidase A domain-containing protein n=1 Tax=Acrobeloides nanus TaxID=290746 RepID=A0A914CBL4_9BILA